MRDVRLGVLVSLLGACVCLAAQPAQQTSTVPAQESRPVFRGGVSLVTMDVSVLDRDRKPVQGLTARDFVVTENGVPQTVTTLTEISVPPPSTTGAAWTREIGDDVVTNTLDSRRLVVIVMNDGQIGPLQTVLTRATAHAVIDQLGPSDLAAVITTYLGRKENFTSDRTKLRAAVDAFMPQLFSGELGTALACLLRPTKMCGPDVLERVGEIINTAPPGRKIVTYIGPPFRPDQNAGDVFRVQLPIGQSSGRALNPFSPSERDGLTALGPMGRMLSSLQASNVTVHEFDPSGLQPVGLSKVIEVGVGEATGGRVVRNTNAPQLVVPAVFAESSSYYLLGYQSTHTTADGRYRRVRVTVGRPDVEVVARSGYFGAPRREPSDRAQPALSPEDTVLARGLPSGDLPLAVTVAPFASANGRTADVAAVLRLREPPPADDERRDRASPASRRVTIVMTAFDNTWRERARLQQTVELTIRPEADQASTYEAVARLQLRPGRYELRFAVTRDGAAGSAFVTVDVPNFSEDRLSLSGVLVERLPAVRPPVGVGLSDLGPSMPTTVRAFGPSDAAVLYARVYQGGTRRPESVTLTTTIRDVADIEVHTRTRVLPPESFSTTRATDHRYELPIDRLEPGEYLVTLAATSLDRRVERMLRITVLP